MPSQSQLHPTNQKRTGFTLIEVLVVVSIIAILMAILIPALAAAKKRGRYADNKSFLSGIADAIETYEQTFNDYPAPPAVGLTNTAASKSMSGTQALLLALSYTWYDTTDAKDTSYITAMNGATKVAIPGTNLVVDTLRPTGPRDHGNQTAAGDYKIYAPFFVPGPHDLPAMVPVTAPAVPTKWYPGGVNGMSASPAEFAFPTIIDHYPTPMPILYFRVTPGVTGTVTFDKDGNPSLASGDTPIVADDPSTGVIGMIYREDCIEYTESGGMDATGNGACRPQCPVVPAAVPPVYSPISALNKTAPVADLNLTVLLTGVAKSQVVKGHGNFVLISAGEDRLYGTADDIVVIR